MSLESFSSLGFFLDGYPLAVLLDALGIDLLPESLFTREPPEFQACYEQALERVKTNPADIEAHYTLGVACLAKRLYKPALAEFQAVLELQSNHAQAWILSSEILSHLGEYEQARTARQRALECESHTETTSKGHANGS